jgi:hypothetical protein
MWDSQSKTWKAQFQSHKLMDLKKKQQDCVSYDVKYANLEVQVHNKRNNKGYNERDVDINHFIINSCA